MATASKMPRYDVRNDGIGPYAVFYCDECSREYRSQPDVAGTITKDIGRQAASDTLRRLPFFGQALADNLTGQDPRYLTALTPQQVDSAWAQMKQYFQECPTCGRILCGSDFDLQSGFCREDSPRRDDMARAEAEQAAGVVKGIVDVFGFSGVMKRATDAAQQAAAQSARCPKCNSLAPVGTKFCPECGSAMLQPSADTCSKCGAQARGAKFCPDCGAKIERAPIAPANCPNCAAETKGAKFCPQCGTKLI